MLHSLESTTQMQEPMSSLGIQNGLVKQSRDTGPSEAWVRIPGHRCLEVRDRIRIRIPGLFSVALLTPQRARGRKERRDQGCSSGLMSFYSAHKYETEKCQTVRVESERRIYEDR